MGNLFEQKYPNNIRQISGLNNIPFQDDVILEVDTTLGAASINLLDIPVSSGLGYWSTQYKLYIVDKSNNAGVNNITVNAPLGTKINGGASFTISSNGASLLVRVASNNNYIGQYSVIAGGTGNGHIIADEGINLPQQPILDFVGKAVNVGNSVGKTIVTINGEISVKNTVYVSKNGSDLTGQVERLDLPYLTISKAILDASAFFVGKDNDNRVRIVIESGLYVENINLQSFIDIDLGDSIVDGYISDNNVDFGAIQDGYWHCIIYGVAQLRKSTIGGAYGQSLILFNSNNNILINCDSIISDINDAIAMIGGYARVVCNNIIGKDIISTSKNAINMAVDNLSTRCTLEVVGANIYTLVGGNSPTIDFAGTVTQTLKLINCSVKTKINNAGSSSAITAGRTSLCTNAFLYLYNTTIFSQNGNSIQVLNSFGVCSLTLYGIHSNIANVNTIANGLSTLTAFINPITIDANLPY